MCAILWNSEMVLRHIFNRLTKKNFVVHPWEAYLVVYFLACSSRMTWCHVLIWGTLSFLSLLVCTTDWYENGVRVLACEKCVWSLQNTWWIRTWWYFREWFFCFLFFSTAIFSHGLPHRQTFFCFTLYSIRSICWHYWILNEWALDKIFLCEAIISLTGSICSLHIFLAVVGDDANERNRSRFAT